MRLDRFTRPHALIPVVALGLTLVTFWALPFHTGVQLASFDIYNMLQVFARLGPLVLALGLTMFAGEFDLSVVGTYALGGMLAVQLGQESWQVGIGAALVAGVLIGAAQGLLIARLGLPSMPVTLAMYILLLGLTSSISGGLSKSLDNAAVTLWVDDPTLVIFSPRSLITLTAFVLAFALLAGSRWGHELRAIGADRRASRVSGVRDDRLLIGVFTVSGVLAAGGGALLSFSLGSANPDPGILPLILAASGALLGGVSLAGGRGNVAGLFAGALSVALLAQIVTVAALQTYVSQLFYAVVLAVVVAVDAPDLRRGLVRSRTALIHRRTAADALPPATTSAGKDRVHEH